MSFFDEFKDIVPYFVKVSVGKNRQFKTDPNKRSYSNYKGKMIAVSVKPRTLEEMQKYGLGGHTEYLPAEQLSLPIDIQVSSNENLTIVFEKTSKYTNKERSHHDIRIFNSDKAQVGYVSFTLTPSGDIPEKTSFYESSDETERIMHTIYNRMEYGKVTKDDCFEFQKNGENGTKKVKISQRDGKVVGCSIIEQDLETKEDVMFQSITRFSKDEKTPKLKRYVASCVVDEVDYNKRGGTLIPYECTVLENDLLRYQKTMHEFQQYAKSFKEETGTELSIKRAIEIGEMPYEKRTMQLPFMINATFGSYANLARYLSDESNNLLRDFKGQYIGNILRLTDKGYEACIVTKHQKEGQDYRLYTLIDFTGTSITQGTGLEEHMGKDPKYLERLKGADKTPTFVTRIGKDGNEELVLYCGKTVSGECQEYGEFVKNFIAPFSEIKPVQISKFLNKQDEKDK